MVHITSDMMNTPDFSTIPENIRNLYNSRPNSYDVYLCLPPSSTDGKVVAAELPTYLLRSLPIMWVILHNTGYNQYIQGASPHVVVPAVDLVPLFQVSTLGKLPQNLVQKYFSVPLPSVTHHDETVSALTERFFDSSIRTALARAVCGSSVFRKLWQAQQQQQQQQQQQPSYPLILDPTVPIAAPVPPLAPATVATTASALLAAMPVELQANVYSSILMNQISLYSCMGMLFDVLINSLYYAAMIQQGKLASFSASQKTDQVAYAKQRDDMLSKHSQGMMTDDHTFNADLWPVIHPVVAWTSAVKFDYERRYKKLAESEMALCTGFASKNISLTGFLQGAVVVPTDADAYGLVRVIVMREQVKIYEPFRRKLEAQAMAQKKT
jgi:hypothetical protein